jgi:hypothetical protein
MRLLAGGAVVAFKVIEGGGPRPPSDFDVVLAKQALRTLVIELLRAIARGNDPQDRVTIQVIEFYRHLAKPGIDIDPVVQTVLKDLNSILTTAEMSTRASDDPDREIEHIILSSFQVAAEQFCLDDAAEGRASQRMRRLENRIEARLRGREKRSRAHGGSFVKEFLERNFRPSKSTPLDSAVRGRRQAGYDVDAYERLQKGEIGYLDLPPGKYPNGVRVYADGEWEDLVRKSPLTKLERAALGTYVKAKGTIGYVKGAGAATNDRLIARGFIMVVQEREAGRASYYGITPAGEAEWLRIVEQDRQKE